MKKTIENKTYEVVAVKMKQYAVHETYNVSNQRFKAVLFRTRTYDNYGNHKEIAVPYKTMPKTYLTKVKKWVIPNRKGMEQRYIDGGLNPQQAKKEAQDKLITNFSTIPRGKAHEVYLIETTTNGIQRNRVFATNTDKDSITKKEMTKYIKLDEKMRCYTNKKSETIDNIITKIKRRNREESFTILPDDIRLDNTTDEYVNSQSQHNEHTLQRKEDLTTQTIKYAKPQKETKKEHNISGRIDEIYEIWKDEETEERQN